MSAGIVAVPVWFLCWLFPTALPHVVHVVGKLLGDSAGVRPSSHTCGKWHLVQTPWCGRSVALYLCHLSPSPPLSVSIYLCLTITVSLFLCLYFLYQAPYIYISTFVYIYIFPYVYIYYIPTHLPADLSILSPLCKFQFKSGACGHEKLAFREE